MVVKITNVALKGRFFILSPQFFPKKKDVPVDKVHPLYCVLLLSMHPLRIRRFHDDVLVRRGIRRYNVFAE